MPNRDDARRDALFRDLARLKELPPAPQTLGAIWNALGQGGSSATSVADVLQRDPALSAKVLRLANSAYFGLPRPASEVRTACVLLGFDTIRAMAVGVAALDTLSAKVGRGLNLEAFWRHSLGVATAAQSLARHAGVDAGTAFCAGILHDVGKLVLATMSPSRYADLDSLAPVDRAAEVLAFGADHAEAGSWLGTRWHLPDEIVTAIRTHHLPAAQMGRWGALIHVADRIAHGAPASPGSAPPEPPEDEILALLPVDAATLHAVEAGFLASLERVDTFADAARSPA